MSENEFVKLVEELGEKMNEKQKEKPHYDKCDKYYISEIAFTMGWINTLDVEKLEKFLEENLDFHKITEFSGMREECHLYIGRRKSVLIVMTSGLTDFGNLIMFCNTPKKIQFQVLKEVARMHFEEFIDDVKKLKDYWKEKDNEDSGLKIINPIVYSVSKSISDKDIDKLEKLINAFLNEEVSVKSIKGLRRYIEKVNKVYYKMKKYK